MKKKDPWFSPTPKISKVEHIIIGVCALVVLFPAIILISIIVFVLILNAHPEWVTTPYKFHHPALYQCQKDWFKFGDNIIRGEYSELYIVMDGKEFKIDFDHSFFDYCISDDILYIIDFNGIYAYNTEFEEIDRYDIKRNLGYRGCFIVKGDYIYYEKNRDVFKYSMITGQDEFLCHIDSNGTYFPFEGLYFSKNLIGPQRFIDLEKDNYTYPGYTTPFNNCYYEIYNEKFGIAYINDNESQLTINNKTFDINSPVRLGTIMHSNSDYVMFYTYNPCCDDCYLGQNCISQLKEVKLWKSDFQKETVTLIKEFNDYTILIAFDEDNYHYYYDGKLYSNDIVVEELSFKLEVGNLFTYYAFKEPNFKRDGVAISKTSFSYIDGKFYYVHNDYPENNEVTQVEY